MSVLTKKPPPSPRGRGTAQAVVGALWTIHPFLSCERRTRHKRPYRRCAPLPPSQRGKLIKTLPVVRPVAEHSIPPNAGEVHPRAREIVVGAIAIHHAHGARALHELHDAEPIGAGLARRAHRAECALQILQNAHFPRLLFLCVPILANPPPPQVASRATFRFFVVSITKGMD